MVTFLVHSLSYTSGVVELASTLSATKAKNRSNIHFDVIFRIVQDHLDKLHLWKESVKSGGG